MYRPLLSSEDWLVSALLGSPFERTRDNLQVTDEYFSPPRTKGPQWFNTDFYLDFVSPLPTKGKRTVEAIPIRQHTMGAELFFITDENGRPARLELLAGEAFPNSYYKEEIGVIEQAIRSLRIGQWPNGVFSADFLRVFDFESCVIFLASNRTDIRSFAFADPTRYVADNSEIHTRNTTVGGCLIEGVISSSRKKESDGWVLCAT